MPLQIHAINTLDGDLRSGRRCLDILHACARVGGSATHLCSAFGHRLPALAWLSPPPPDGERAAALNQRARHYVGRIFTLEQPIVNGEGKIRVDDSLWKIRGADCPSGTRVEVTDIDGVVLKIRPKG